MQSRINPDQSIETLMTVLIGWLGDVLPGTTAAHLPLHGTASSDGITLRLIGITLGARRVGPMPLQLMCDVLVTVTNADPLRESTAFARLLLATADRPEVRLLDAPPVLQLCATLGITPALGCILRVATELAKPDEPPVRRVRFPLLAEIGQMGAISGTVLGPGDIPVAGAAISADGFGRSVRTDRAGRFRLPGVVVGATTLTVRGRGVETTADVTEANADQPITIPLPLEV